MYTYEEIEPLSPWGYLWLTLLYAIPVVGLVFLGFHSLSKSVPIDKRNFARSRVCLIGIGIFLICVFVLILYLSGILLRLNNAVTHALT